MSIIPNKNQDKIDLTTELFLARINEKYDLEKAILFGSYARHEARAQSDMDIAILLRGLHAQRADTALDMASIAFDVMMETGILVDAVPFWMDEWQHPENFKNPALIKNIQQDGILL
ncbi:MAG: nucleotidyltransferase domain-containing protein [gamma proteobacterium symbiont of Taylorina sp.]|nr:nucleotidyltransferase domain-containing protein [gamma proteobacterium symbiont of Taylorina sp.]